jgi:hypothetical protein
VIGNASLNGSHANGNGNGHGAPARLHAREPRLDVGDRDD